MKWIYVVENTLEKQNARLTHVIEFCHAVKKTDNLILVSQSNPSALSQLADFECLQIKPIHIRPHNLGYIFNTIKAFFYLRKLLKITKPDVIYERAGGFSLGPLLIARFKHIPAILEINGNWDEEQKLALKQVSFPAKALVALTNKLRSFSLTLACQIATQLIVVSPNIARFLQKKGVRDKDKILIVTNGVNVERFTPMDMTICKKDLNLDGNVDYIGFIGSLSAWQGVEDLILAYSHLPQELTSKFHLLIVGDGPEYKRCHDLCEQVDLDNSVIFTGARPYISIPQHIGACSVLVAPRKPFPCSPLKLYEYMSCARPIIASNIQDMEFIEKQGLGFLFPPGDVNNLAEKLQAVLNLSDEEKKVMSNRCRQYVLANCSWDVVVQTIRKFVISGSTNKQ